MSTSDDPTFNADQYQKLEWLTESEVGGAAISTAMKKVLALAKKQSNPSKVFSVTFAIAVIK